MCVVCLCTQIHVCAFHNRTKGMVVIVQQGYDTTKPRGIRVDERNERPSKQAIKQTHKTAINIPTKHICAIVHDL